MRATDVPLGTPQGSFVLMEEYPDSLIREWCVIKVWSWMESTPNFEELNSSISIWTKVGEVFHYNNFLDIWNQIIKIFSNLEWLFKNLAVIKSISFECDNSRKDTEC